MPTIAIRRENKSRYERRAPLDPGLLERSRKEHGLEFVVEPSPVRIFEDTEYLNAGANMSNDFRDAGIVLGVKEIPTRLLEQDKAYLYFSHTIKVQRYNMGMLRRLMDLNCTLLDYELIADDNGKRLVFFGYHAGLAGMIDTWWTVGKRLKQQGLETPFADVRQALEYDDLEEAQREFGNVAKHLEAEGLPEELCPFVVGYSGYGNVSQGAQHVSDWLPTIEVTPAELRGLWKDRNAASRHHVYEVVFKEEHLARRSRDGGFDLQEYFDAPEGYEARFAEFLPSLRVLVNCIYWEARYPKLVTRELAQGLHKENTLPLIAIGDITCDIEGSIEMTTKATDQEQPVLVYDPGTDTVEQSFDGPGFAIVAVDNLPAELSRDSTRHFGRSLFDFLPALASLDRSAGFEDLSLWPELKRAIIVWNGELTPDYKYLSNALDKE